MGRTYLTHAALLLGVFLFYAGFAAHWPFHIMLLAVIIVTFLYQLRIGMYWALLGGVLLDGFTVSGNGMWALGFLLTSLGVHYLIQAWFPARSLLSAASVGALGVLIFEVVTRSFGQLLASIDAAPLGSEWTIQAPFHILIHMIWAVIIVTIVVGVVRSASMGLKTAYLIR